MKELNGLFVLIIAVTMTLAGCGGGGGGGSTGPAPQDPTQRQQTPATPGTLITSQDSKPVTAFLQTVINSTSKNEYFPSQANIWDIDRDFDLVNDQFVDGLSLTVGNTFFLDDQTYGELSFYTPVMDGAKGVRVADVSDGARIGQGYFPLDPSGLLSAYLNATSDSRLQQLVTLPSTTALTLTWQDQVALEVGSFPGYTPSYRVVLRDTAGALLQELFSTTTTTNPGGDHTADLSFYAGQSIVLSFEEHSAPRAGYETFAIVDAVSIKDAGSNEYMVNGAFENGLASWTTNTPAEVQNMTSGARTIEGLDVTRSFYTMPNKMWGRWVDVFENKTSESITKTITYDTSLSSGVAGIIYAPLAEAQKRALVVWDSTAQIRDTGLVFGNAATVSYTSASALTSMDGKDVITVTYTITVPPNGRIALVNFIIMNGTYTGQTASASTARASAIDTEVFNIITKFWSEAQYRDGMTQQQMDAISNF
jgi:hypothetical protein